MTATFTASEVASLTDSPPSTAYESQPAPIVTISIYSEQQSPRWLPYVARRLNELASRSNEPTPEAIGAPDPWVLKHALVVLSEWLSDDTPTPSVVPTPDGGVQFVWHKSGWDIEIEVLPSETYVWGRNRNDTGREFSGDLPERAPELQAALREMSTAATGGHD